MRMNRKIVILDRVQIVRLVGHCLGLLLLQAPLGTAGAPVGSASEEIARLEKDCNAGKTQACKDLADEYYDGDRVTEDKKRAATLYEKACNAGLVTACVNIADIYATGLFLPCDEKRAAALYKKACDGGEKDACGAAEHNLCTKSGVTATLIEGLKTFCNSGDSGMGSACLQLGELLEAGPPGAARDLVAAAEAYKKASQILTKDCESGQAAACGDLARMYEQGKRMAKDKAHAAALFKRACTGGDAEACASLKRLMR